VLTKAGNRKYIESVSFPRFAIILAAALALHGQELVFEVASIKPSRSASDESNFDSTKGALTVTNAGMRELIRMAFGVKDYQIQGAPGWIDKERYDIAAKIVGGRNLSFDELKAALRELLASRFRMTSHRETRQLPVYVLSVGKTSSKLTADNQAARTSTRTGCGHLAARHVTVDVLATMLSRQLDRDVLNQTGLEGKFDFDLDWRPDTGACVEERAAYPSIMNAVREQLGLVMRASKGPVEILVIDRLEKPSEN